MGSIDKKIMIRVTHFLIFNAWNKGMSPVREKLLLQIPIFLKNGTWRSNFYFIETLWYLNVKFSLYRYHNGIFYANFLCIDTSTFSKLSFLQPTGRRRIFLSEEQICNLLWHSQPIVNCVNWKILLHVPETNARANL